MGPFAFPPSRLVFCLGYPHLSFKVIPSVYGPMAAVESKS